MPNFELVFLQMSLSPRISPRRSPRRAAVVIRRSPSPGRSLDDSVMPPPLAILSASSSPHNHIRQPSLGTIAEDVPVDDKYPSIDIEDAPLSIVTAASDLSSQPHLPPIAEEGEADESGTPISPNIPSSTQPAAGRLAGISEAEEELDDSEDESYAEAKDEENEESERKSADIEGDHVSVALLGVIGRPDKVAQSIAMSAAAARASDVSCRGSLAFLRAAPFEPLRGVDLADLRTVRTLGVGTFGRVNLVRHSPTGSVYALKVSVLQVESTSDTKKKRGGYHLIPPRFCARNACFRMGKRRTRSSSVSC